MDTDNFGAIGAVLGKLKEAFTTHNTQLLKDVYTEDVRWINAFGKNLKGKANVMEYLDGLFKEPRFTAGKLKDEPKVEFDIISEDIIVVTISSNIIGQQTTQGEIPLRQNLSLKVVKKTPDGWRIASEIYMDARTDVTFKQEG